MTSPSKPVSIGSPRLRPNDNEQDEYVGTPDLRLLRQQFGTPPVGTTIPRFRPSSSTPHESPLPLSSATDIRAPAPISSSLDTPPPFLSDPPSEPIRSPKIDLPEDEKMKVLRKHLVSREQRLGEAGPSRSHLSSRKPSIHEPGSSQSASRSSSKDPSQRHALRENSEPFPLPYNAPGGDITHEIYKYQERAHRNARPRTVSLMVPHHTVPQDAAFEHIHEPGGFRRNYMILRATNEGTEEPPVTSTFIDFLYIFGHFAGEDLEEETSDDELGAIDEEAPPLYYPPPQAGASGSILRRETTRRTVGPAAVPEPTSPIKLLTEEPSESTPLIREDSIVRRRSRRSLSRSRRSRRSSVGPHGDATVSQAILMLLKAFIGTGVLFLGKAFSNGGMLFSTVTLVAIALISLYSFLLLVSTKMVVPGSFGDIGGALYGSWMKRAILTSIVISQLGFVAAYTIFVAENLQAFVMSVSKCKTLIPIQVLIFSQLVVFLPLAMIRNLAKLSLTALIADVFILIGIVYIGWNEIMVISERGIAPVKWFNEKDFPLLIGTAVFSFEGIGLVIPITDAMREPRKFPNVLTGVMFFLIVLFGGAGILSYGAYGEDIQTVVIKNLPQDHKFVQVVQFLYSIAILLSAPLQLFPALRIMENWLFTKSGKVDLKVKWEKNFFRMIVVIFTYFVSWAGARDLDKFVAFVGSFACVPLCFVYPAMLHLKACARSRKDRILDYTMIGFGILASIYTTTQTIKLMAIPSAGDGRPKFENCPPTPGKGGLLF